jgi:hypothetical protein
MPPSAAAEVAVLASVVVAAPPALAEGDAAADDPGAIEPAAEDSGAIELAAAEAGAEEPAAAGADAAGALLLLELLELPEGVLLEPQAAATSAITATPAARPVRAKVLLLAEPGVVGTRTSSS